MKSKFKNIHFLIIISILSMVSCRRKDNDVDNIYRFDGKLTVDGRERTYLLNLPPNYYDSSNFALVIAMHGGGGTSSQFEATSKLSEKANSAHFIVVYPDGVKSDGILKAQTWNAGRCCDYAVEKKIDDVKFIRTLIDELISKYKINPMKVFATGHSNGGMMSYRLACELGSRIAAIAPNACTMQVLNDCRPGRPVPVLHLHSELDENIPYQGGVGNGPTPTYNPPVDSVLHVFGSNNFCTSKNVVVTTNNGFTHRKWSGCNNNANIEYYLTTDGGHSWPGGLPGRAGADEPSKVINANDLIWEFFKKYQML